MCVDMRRKSVSFDTQVLVVLFLFFIWQYFGRLKAIEIDMRIDEGLYKPAIIKTFKLN